MRANWIRELSYWELIAIAILRDQDWNAAKFSSAEVVNIYYQQDRRTKSLIFAPITFPPPTQFNINSVKTFKHLNVIRVQILY